MKELWDQKLRGFQMLEEIMSSGPVERLSFSEALSWNDQALAFALSSPTPPVEASIEEKVRRVARLQDALAVLER